MESNRSPCFKEAHAILNGGEIRYLFATDIFQEFRDGLTRLATMFLTQFGWCDGCSMWESTSCNVGFTWWNPPPENESHQLLSGCSSALRYHGLIHYIQHINQCVHHARRAMIRRVETTTPLFSFVATRLEAPLRYM